MSNGVALIAFFYLVKGSNILQGTNKQHGKQETLEKEDPVYCMDIL